MLEIIFPSTRYFGSGDIELDEQTSKEKEKIKINLVLQLKMKLIKTMYIMRMYNVIRSTAHECKHAPEFFVEAEFLLEKNGWRNSNFFWLQFLSADEPLLQKEIRDHC
jgi:hypothetical protein